MYAVDFDGTLCDTHTSKCKYVLDRHGCSIKPWEANRSTITRNMEIMSDSEYNEMVDEVCCRENTLATDPVPGSYEALEELSDSGTVYILTGRNGKYLSAAVEWMDEQGMDDFIESYISSELCKHPKMAICEKRNITYLVDDDPGHFQEFNGSVTGVLLRYGYRGEMKNNGFNYARDWPEAMKYLL